MGALRLLFAVCVVLWHCPEGLVGRFIHPALAVQCFYAISGFLIQMVIRLKYQGGAQWRRRFLASRFLRIYPLYILFLMLTAVLVGTGNSDLGFFLAKDEILAGLIYTFNNFFIVGQDVLRFFYFDVNSWHFTVLPATEEQRHAILAVTGQMTVLGQSWTLALEFYFYLLAPFLLVCRTRTLSVLLALLIALRFWLGHNEHYQSEWLYGFFPCELAIFLLGSLSCRVYFLWFASGRLTALIGSRLLRLICGVIIYGSCLIYMNTDLNFVSGYPWLGKIIPAGSWGRPLGAPAGYWLILLMTVVILPFAFHFSTQFGFDRFIGELSYPVYISHFLILEIVTKATHGTATKNIGLYVLMISIGLSILLTRYFEQPLDSLRHRMFYRRGVRSNGSKQMQD